jgi:hypothetical protein
LKPSDVVLLEDGKPREFTIFDSASTQGRMPPELVLLFDTNPTIPYFWIPRLSFCLSHSGTKGRRIRSGLSAHSAAY